MEKSKYSSTNVFEIYESLGFYKISIKVKIVMENDTFEILFEPCDYNFAD